MLGTLVGYSGGEGDAPTYRSMGGHTESVLVAFDPAQVSVETLLDVFWHNIDPTQSDGQFCDHGRQYRTGIFVANAEERRLAQASKRRVAQRLGQRIVTEITDAGPFWLAEDYHQDFYRTNPSHYQRYRTGCGRDRRLRELWGASAGH